VQTKFQSLLESLVNVAVGYIVAVLTQVLVLPLFGFHASLSDNLLIGLLFTIVSIIRSYCLRRLFNRWHSKVKI